MTANNTQRRKHHANNRKIPYYLTFSSASSRRFAAKNARLIYKISSLQARRFHFRIGTGRPNRGVHGRGKVSFASRAAVQFPRDVSISVGRRAPFRRIRFHDPLHTPPFPSHHRDTYRRCQIPLFSIRWWINSSYSKTIAPSTIAVCIPIGSIDFR